MSAHFFFQGFNTNPSPLVQQFTYRHFPADALPFTPVSISQDQHKETESYYLAMFFHLQQIFVLSPRSRRCWARFPGPGADFLCGACMFSPCLCRFPLGAPVPLPLNAYTIGFQSGAWTPLKMRFWNLSGTFLVKYTVKKNLCGESKHNAKNISVLSLSLTCYYRMHSWSSDINQHNYAWSRISSHTS